MAAVRDTTAYRRGQGGEEIRLAAAALKGWNHAVSAAVQRGAEGQRQRGPLRSPRK